jgi:hypothetical protein
MDLRHIRGWFREELELAKIAVVHQFLDRGWFKKVIPHKPHARGPWRGAEANEWNASPCWIGQPLVDHLPAKMALVHDDDIGSRDSAANQGLRRRDLNGRCPIITRVIALDHANMPDPLALEMLDRLVNQDNSRNDKDHQLGFPKGAAHDLGRDAGFSGPRRQLQNRTRTAGKEGLPQH